MRRTYLILFFLLTLIIPLHAAMKSPRKPDFAYPKTVADNAMTQLREAIASGNDPAAVRALLDYSLAEGQIDRTRVPEALGLIGETRPRLSSPAAKAMTYLLEAEIFSDIYQEDRWKYDRRTSPLTPLPDDIYEWSGTQFHMHINALLDSVMSGESALASTPVSGYEGVITLDRTQKTYFPTLWDFAAFKSISILSTFGGGHHFSVRLLDSPCDYIPAMPLDPTGERMLQLYASVIGANKADTPAGIFARVERLQFIGNNLVRSGRNDEYDVNPLDNALLRLYESYLSPDGKASTQWSGDILCAITPSVDDRTGNQERESSRRLLTLIRKFLADYPAYGRNNCLLNSINTLTARSVSVRTGQVLPAGRPVTIFAELLNQTSATLNIYDASSLPVVETGVSDKDLARLGRPVATLRLETAVESEMPYSATVSREYTFPKVGTYIIAPAASGLTGDNYHTKIYVTDISLASSSFCGENRLWAVSPSDGAPLRDVKLTLQTSSWRNPKTLAIGSTGADGSLLYDKVEYGTVTASKGSDRFALPFSFYPAGPRSAGKDWIRRYNAYTSLPLYHPGDTVDFVAVCYETRGEERRVVEGLSVTARLNNASWVDVDTVTITTDRFGRAVGSFRIPTDGLQGTYRISFNNECPIAFEVSDYKLPSFMVETDTPAQGIPSLGDVTLRGTVRTYSGFPLADTRISIALSVCSRPRWWWYSESYPVDNLTAETGADGRFEIVVPKSVFEGSPLPDGYYTADISALSQSGETQTATVSFGLSARYIIRPELAANTDISSGLFLLKAGVFDSDNKTVDIPVSYAVSDSTGKLLTEGVMRGGVAQLDVAGWKSAEYKFSLALADSTLADKVNQTAILYNPTLPETPEPSRLLWSASTNLEAGADGSVRWLCAFNCPAHLLVTVMSGDKVISQDWYKTPGGMDPLDLTLPEGIDKATAAISVTGNYTTATETLSITRRDTRKGLKITVESFRDRIIPGETETWRFRVADLSGRGREAAVVADLYNKALDALARSDWSTSLYRIPGPQWSWRMPELDNRVYSSARTHARYLECKGLSAPGFETYGLSWATMRRMFKSRMYSLGAATPQLSATDDFENEASMDMAAPAQSSMIRNEMKASDAVLEEAVVETADAGSGAPSDDTDRKPEEAAPFSYRDAETPLAFFKPSLTTSPDGELEITFTAPNANTRWGLELVAWTDSMLTASHSAAVTASKPVMVRPNPPRFLRAGDRCAISALVMNNTDDSADVTTVIEIFNPSTGETLASAESTDTVAANGYTTVEYTLTAPSGIPFIGYRIKSSAGNYADGEQITIPVLEATTPVIETYPFYMAPSQHEFTMPVPSVGADGRMTLQFCENPVWYVITALPGVIDSKPSTAPETAYNLFSAAIAEGLVRDNPAIADAIDEWKRSGKDSQTLTSMLERNQELKTVLLKATPWMLDARNDTERMARLSLLLDRKFIAKTMTEAIDGLSKLQTSEGGFRWMSDYREPSRWATESVLFLLGSLTNLGYLPDNGSLRLMITKALYFVESEVKRDYAKYPDGDYTSYVVLFDQFASLGIKPTLTPIVNQVVNRMLRDWKNHTLAWKAIDAMTLNLHGYPSVAREILGSIREFEVSSPEKGIWFPALENEWMSALLYQGKIGVTSLILDAFARLEPDAPEIDGIRQWLVIQKGAQDWGSSAITTEVIASFLQSSRSWVTPAKGSEVKIGGKKIETTPADRMTGEFEIAVPLPAKGKLKIAKKGDTPAWGALYCSYTDSIADVKAHSCPELSVVKSLILTRPGQEPVLISPDTPLAVGDKVEVRLTVKCDLDMSYVVITDDRPACLEPVEQLPTPVFSEGMCFYRENRDTETRLFIDRLRKGVYQLSYSMWVNNAGSFISGIATVQSQYAPRYSAHSGAGQVNVAD